MSELLPADSFFTISGFYPESSLEALPAKTSAQPTPKAKASKEKGRVSTSKQSASSEKSDLVGSLLRTALISELEAQTSSSLHWKNSATPAGRSWSVLATSAQIMRGPDRGLSDATSNKLPTPVKPNGGRSLSVEAIETGKRANGAKAQVDTPNMLKHAFTMLHTPTAKANMHHPSMEKWPSCDGWAAIANPGALPTPTKRDKRMDRWSPAYDRRKSPTMDAVLDGAMTGKAPGKWDYARQIAAMLSDAGLTGPSMTLPIVYCWMLGYRPGHLSLFYSTQEGKNASQSD